MAGTQKINGFYFKVSYDTIYVGKYVENDGEILLDA